MNRVSQVGFSEIGCAQKCAICLARVERDESRGVRAEVDAANRNQIELLRILEIREVVYFGDFLLARRLVVVEPDQAVEGRRRRVYIAIGVAQLPVRVSSPSM